MTSKQKSECAQFEAIKTAIANQARTAFYGGVVRGLEREIDSTRAVEDSSFVIRTMVDGQPVCFMVAVNRVVCGA